jgi:uncharacterized protein YxeA
MKKIIILVIIIILVGAGFFIYLNSKGKGSWKIEAPQAAVENQRNGDNQEDIIVDTNENSIDLVEEEKQVIPDTQSTEAKAETKEVNLSPSYGIISKLVSWGYKSVGSRNIDTIVIHSSYDALGGDKYSVDGLLSEYKSYGVAPHYLIDRAGKIYQLVADKNIAYHAGVSQVPDGRKSVNDFSIGIEMMNTETGKFTGEQYTALKNLIVILRGKYKIKYVLGHNQIAEGRKTDPWNFDWNKI